MTPTEMQDAILFQHQIIFAVAVIVVLCLAVILAVLLVHGDKL